MPHHHRGARLPRPGPRTCAASGAGSGSSSSSSSAGGSSSSGAGGAAEPAGLLGLVRRWQRDTQQLQEQLKALGAAGVIAYGLFNTLYYTVAFLIVWFQVADVPSGMGWAPASQKAAEVLALVWAGSQVTKLLRAGAALACAPLIDRGLERLGLQDKRRAYLLVVVCCILLAVAVFGLVIARHA